MGQWPIMSDTMNSSFDPNGFDAATPTGASSPAARGAQGTYVNPVLDSDFPDPAVILAPDGYYYAYATQTLRDDRWINIQVARSSDLIHWEQLGDALTQKP